MNTDERGYEPSRHEGPTVRGTLEFQMRFIAAIALIVLLSVAPTAARADDLATFQALTTQFNQLVFSKQYAKAEPVGKRLIEFTDRTFPEDVGVQFMVSSLVLSLYGLQDRYADAEPLMKRGLALSDRLGKLAPDTLPTIVTSLNNFADAFSKQQQFVEETRLRRRAVQVVEQVRGPSHPDLVQPLVHLGMAAGLAKRQREAEHYWRKAVSIGDTPAGQKNPYFAMALSFLASNLTSQRRLAEAEPIARRALAISERGGPAATMLPGSLGMLSGILEQQGRFAEAEPLRKRALDETRQQSLMLKEQFVASAKVDLARVCRQQRRFGDAEAWLNDAIKDLQAAASNDADAALFPPLLELVHLDDDRGQPAAAQRTLVRIFASRTEPTFFLYATRARLHWKQDQRSDALADMSQALDLAEQVRKTGGGGEQERAELYSQFADLFETMIAWRHELGDTAAAFAAAERFRARSMIDQLEFRGVDLLAGLPAEEAARLKRSEAAARVRVATLEKQTAQARTANRGALPANLDSSLADARQALVEAYREIRNASSTYRLAVQSDYKPADLGEVQSRLAKSRELLLSYTLGKERSFVLVAPPAPEPAQIHELIVSTAAAETLGIAQGPLTADRCRELLNRRGRAELAGAPRGLDLSGGQSPAVAADRLAALWDTLVPRTHRESLVSGTFAGLVVLPDGPLSLLPFEMLVVGRDETGAPRYLLDAGPPIRYGPSATVLENLANRTLGDGKANQAPALLTVGDPAYPVPSEKQVGDSILGALEVAAQYRSAAGGLGRLPASRIESAKLAEAFRERGLSVEQLLGDRATEIRVRGAAPGRRVVHLACHGLADQSYGNFFGALAMTPGTAPESNPADDGFLTLPEIYDLHMTGCELAILSACETNYGPQQDGEGTWALSRGFLVAGVRRVVASNWLVDDQSASEMIGDFAAHLAAAYADNNPPHHAAALQAAKRKVRQQPRWSDPYYWAAFVLIGPD